MGTTSQARRRPSSFLTCLLSPRTTRAYDHRVARRIHPCIPVHLRTHVDQLHIPARCQPTYGGLASGWDVELIHMRPKVDRDARMDPPSHTVIIRSGGAMTLTLAPSATRPSISAWRRSGMFGNMVVPPDMTMLQRRSLRTSRSQSSTVFLASSCRPIISLPSMDGLNISSGQRMIWLCTVTTDMPM